MTKGKLYLWTEMNKQLQNNPHIIYEKLNHDTVGKGGELLDEAKREFPELRQDGVDPWHSKDYYDVDEIQEWFKKWFGSDEE